MDLLILILLKSTKMNKPNRKKINKIILNRKVIVILIISLSLFSCNKNNKDLMVNKNEIVFSKFPKEEKLYFKELFEFKEGVPGILYLVDSTLIMFNVNPSAEFSLFNYSLKNRSISKKYLGRGRGPGEVISAVNLGINGNYLWVYDVTLKKILVTDKSSAIDTDLKVSFKEFPARHYFYNIHLKDSFNYYGIGSTSSEFKIQKMDLISDKKISEFGKFESSNVSINSIKQIFESFIYIKPSGNKVVLPYRFTDMIEIFNLETQKGKALHGPVGFDVDYSLVNGNMHRTENTRHAFVGGTVTDHYIYLLYSGTLDVKENPYYGKQIYIYDWEGNPIKKIILDRDVLSLAVSEDDKTIYIYDVNNGSIAQANLKL